MRTTATLILVGLAGLAACTGQAATTGDDDDDVGDDDDDDVDLPDAAPVSNRVTDGLAALYRFDGTAGQTTIADTSGVGDPLDLTITDPALVTWGAGFITLTEATPTLIATAGPATKLTDACKGSSEMTIEAWLKPASLTTNGRVLASSLGTNRNFQLKQQNAGYVSRVRTSSNPTGQSPEVTTLIDTATLVDVRHIVATRIASGAQANYVDAVKQLSASNTGTFVVWDDTYSLSLGSDGDGANPWGGDLYLAAIYCRALTDAEIKTNFDDGY